MRQNSLYQVVCAQENNAEDLDNICNLVKVCERQFGELLNHKGDVAAIPDEEIVTLLSMLTVIRQHMTEIVGTLRETANQTFALIDPDSSPSSTSDKRDCDLRYIRAKLPFANEKCMGLIAAFVSGLRIEGWDEAEYNREL